MSAEEEMEFFNPWHQFIGCFLPNWLLEREELSLGAKVTYARLAQFAGRKGYAVVHRPELAKKIASSDRSAGTYLNELAEVGLIHATRQGPGKPNLYNFVRHPWMNDALVMPDRQDLPIKIGKNRPADRQDLPVSPTERESKKREPRLAAITVVFDVWKAETGRNGSTKLTDDRRAKINARLDEGYTVEQLVTVVSRGWKADPWPERKNQNDLTILLRSGSQVEKFLEHAGGARRPSQQSEREWKLESTRIRLERRDAEREALRARRPA